MDGEKSVVQDEKVLKAKSGYAMLLLGIIGMLLGVAVIIAGCMVFGQTGETNTALLAGSIILGVLLIVGFNTRTCGLRVLNPNEAYVFALFGKYYGTIKTAGFFWVNPFCEAINHLYVRQHRLLHPQPCQSGSSLRKSKESVIEDTDAEQRKAESQR